MATVIGIDDFVAEEWYPGFRPGYGHAPWVVDPADTFRPRDVEAFWFLDFHWPRGVTPMGWIWNEDGYNWGTQLAAESLPLPRGRGITSRVAGTHVYASAIPVTDPREVAARTKRLDRALPTFLRDFEPIWAARREEIEDAWQYFRSVDTSALSLRELGDHLVAARQFHKRAFEIHFEVMYPLLTNFVSFYRQCVQFGLEPGRIGQFLQGYDTKILQTDRALWELTASARRHGLQGVFAAHDAGTVRGALAAHGGPAGEWLREFGDFLQTYGWRTEGSADIALPSWVEDPTSPLGTIKTFLQKGTPHDFAAAAAAAVAEREEAIDAARATLTRREQAVFDAGLTACTAANFSWWQDEHNHYIDLRVALPMRWACQAIAERVGADHSDDVLFLFWPETMDLVAGRTSFAAQRSLIEARRQFFEHWGGRRAQMPKMLGTIPDAVEDPILIEIFGIDPHYLATLERAAAAAAGGEPVPEVRILRGVPAAKGQARGVARVLAHADELHRIQPGEVLVCESTSPNWTPAFAKIAACVCDGGGTLSHAAIVGREYGVPTVTALGVATVEIRDGDEVDVDGSAGTVTVYRRADA